MSRMVWFWLSFSALISSQGFCASVYHDFGGAGDLDSSSPMYFEPGPPDWSKIWYLDDSNPVGFYENGADFHWTQKPSVTDGYTDSRAVFFRRLARIRIDARGLPSSGQLYLTVRYKDNLEQGTYGGVPLWSVGLLGTLGGSNDHRWKTETIPVMAESLRRDGDDFVIRVGDNYSDQMAGELNIDKVKLSADQGRSEFEADAPGLWPSIEPSRLRFGNIGRDNIHRPGSEPFFPFAMYLAGGIITEGGTATSPGYGSSDSWVILEDARFNAVIVHGWQFDWGSRWLVFPNESPWASPGQYVEMGLQEMLIQAGGHNIKVMPNFLTDTRSYWIDMRDGGAPATLERLSNVARSFADHPVIWGWNPVDEWDHENSGYGKPHLFSHQLYKAMKDNDPNKPVFTSLIGFGHRLGWRQAARESDILASDAYFDDNGDLEEGALRLANFLDEMRWELGDSKLKMAILHFGEEQSAQRDYNGIKRLPNETEVLFQAYLSIAHGAQGLAYFRMIHPDAQGYTGLDASWRGLRQLGDELFGSQGIAHALINPSRTLDIMGEAGLVSCSNPDVDFILKQTGNGARLLIAVNRRQSTQDAVFSVAGLEDRLIPVHFENRYVQASGGLVSDSFSRFARHVYLLDGSIDGSPAGPPEVPAPPSEPTGITLSIKRGP